MSRRQALRLTAAGTGGLLLAACSSAGSNRSGDTGQTGSVAKGKPTRFRYGSDPSQWGDLSLPDATPALGTVVVIHGGFWLSEYGADLGAPLAADLARRGYVAWNLEYRRVGNGGGWPATLQDVADGIDHLAELAKTEPRIELDHVAALGHSAGGQLAVWAMARGGLPSGAPGVSPVVRLAGAVAQAGVLDLRYAAQTGVGGTAEADLLGGTPSRVPDRYALASPIERLPIHLPVRCIHSKADQNVPFSQSTRYVAAAGKVGDDAQLVEVSGDHFTLIDPTSAAWRAAVDSLPPVLGH